MRVDTLGPSTKAGLHGRGSHQGLLGQRVGVFGSILSGWKPQKHQSNSHFLSPCAAQVEDEGWVAR